MRQGIERERVTKVLLPNSSNYISAAKHTAAIIEQAPVLIVVCNPSGHSLYEDLTPEEKFMNVLICNLLVQQFKICC